MTEQRSGDELYAWQVQERDGRWSMVGALIPATGTHSPLVARSFRIAQHFEPLAREHAVKTGQKLRLAKFILMEVVKT
jgi:hypothetical protein